MPGIAEERVEDDERRTEDHRRLEQPEEAADDLVDEARLLEQRLRLVEALDDERERDDGGDEDRQRTRSCSCTRGGNCVQFCAEELASGSARFAASRNENRIEPMPSSRRIVPCAKPSTKKPMKNRTMSRSTVPIAAEEFPEIHAVASVQTAPGGAGAAQG